MDYFCLSVMQALKMNFLSRWNISLWLAGWGLLVPELYQLVAWFSSYTGRPPPPRDLTLTKQNKKTKQNKTNQVWKLAKTLTIRITVDIRVSQDQRIWFQCRSVLSNSIVFKLIDVSFHPLNHLTVCLQTIFR